MKIVTDTASLISPKEAESLGIVSVPVGLSIDGQTYKDYNEITTEALMSHINKGASLKSTQPAVWEVMEVLNSEDDTLVISIGDGLSGTYATNVGVKTSLEAGNRVSVVDSKTLAGALRYLVFKAVELRKQNLSMKEIIGRLQESIQDSHSFVIPFDFDFLKRSGRLTALAAKLLSATKVVPVLTLSEDRRKIEILKINRTIKKAVDCVVQKMKSLNINEQYIIHICHARDEVKAKAIYETLRKEFENIKMEILELSPALCLHGGPSSLVIQVTRR